MRAPGSANLARGAGSRSCSKSRARAATTPVRLQASTTGRQERLQPDRSPAKVAAPAAASAAPAAAVEAEIAEKDAPSAAAAVGEDISAFNAPDSPADGTPPRTPSAEVAAGESAVLATESEPVVAAVTESDDQRAPEAPAAKPRTAVAGFLDDFDSMVTVGKRAEPEPREARRKKGRARKSGGALSGELAEGEKLMNFDDIASTAQLQAEKERAEAERNAAETARLAEASLRKIEAFSYVPESWQTAPPAPAKQKRSETGGEDSDDDDDVPKWAIAAPRRLDAEDKPPAAAAAPAEEADEEEPSAAPSAASAPVKLDSLLAGFGDAPGSDDGDLVSKADRRASKTRKRRDERRAEPVAAVLRTPTTT